MIPHRPFSLALACLSLALGPFACLVEYQVPDEEIESEAGGDDDDDARPLPECPEDFESCELGCSDLSYDPANCGECGHECESQLCHEGRCVPQCESPDAWCEGDCVNTLDDPWHCGACGHECAEEALCIDGQCVPFFDVSDDCESCPCFLCDDDEKRCCPLPELDGALCVDLDHCPEIDP